MSEFSQDFLDDQDLLTSYRGGNDLAYGELYRKYSSLALGYARRFASNRAGAEDLASEAFTRILETIRSGNGPTISMKYYLLTTVRTVATRSAALAKREDPRAPDVIASMFEQESFGHDSVELAEWIVAGFNALAERQQRIIWLHTVEGVKLKEIAEQLDIHPSSVTRAYQGALAEMKKAFVTDAVAATSNPSCLIALDQLLAVAQTPRLEVSGHLVTCSRCSAITRRLRAKDAVLMSIVLLPGLGALGEQALKTSAWGWFSAQAMAVKIAFVAVPLVAIATAGTLIVVQDGSVSSGPGTTSTVVLGEPVSDGSATGAGSPAELVAVGNCALTRAPLGTSEELWSIGDNPDCAARIVLLPSVSGADPTLIMDSEGPRGGRFAEIARAGDYRVELSDATTSVVAEIHVVR